MIESYDVYTLLKPSECESTRVIGKTERVTFKCLPLIALAPGIEPPPEPFVRKHASYPTSQLAIVWGLNWILEKHEVDVVYLSLGWTGAFDPTDPVQIATRYLYENGVVVVIASGNYGPEPDTMQALARAPWVISVGATNDRMELLECSGRGSQGGTKPTVVSNGTDTMSNPFPPGTSFAAARVAFSIGWLRASLRLMSAQFLEVLKPEQTNFILDPPITRPMVGSADTGIDHIPEKRRDKVYVTVGKDEKKWYHEFGAWIPEAYWENPDNPDVIRRAVEIAAYQMPKWQLHEVGAGYFDDDQVWKFLTNITPSRWCMVFYPEILEDDKHQATLSKLDQALGPLWPDLIVQTTKYMFREETQIVMAKVM